MPSPRTLPPPSPFELANPENVIHIPAIPTKFPLEIIQAALNDTCGEMETFISYRPKKSKLLSLHIVFRSSEAARKACTSAIVAQRKESGRRSSKERISLKAIHGRPNPDKKAEKAKLGSHVDFTQDVPAHSPLTYATPSLHSSNLTLDPSLLQLPFSAPPDPSVPRRRTARIQEKPRVSERPDSSSSAEGSTSNDKLNSAQDPSVGPLAILENYDISFGLIDKDPLDVPSHNDEMFVSYPNPSPLPAYTKQTPSPIMPPWGLEKSGQMMTPRTPRPLPAQQPETLASPSFFSSWLHLTPKTNTKVPDGARTATPTRARALTLPHSNPQTPVQTVIMKRRRLSFADDPIFLDRETSPTTEGPESMRQNPVVDLEITFYKKAQISPDPFTVDYSAAANKTEDESPTIAPEQAQTPARHFPIIPFPRLTPTLSTNNGFYSSPARRFDVESFPSTSRYGLDRAFSLFSPSPSSHSHAPEQLGGEESKDDITTSPTKEDSKQDGNYVEKTALGT